MWTCSMAYVPEKQTFLLQDLRMDIMDVGVIHARIECFNFDLVKIKALNFDNLVVQQLFFAYEDHSLLRKLVQIAQVDEGEIIDFLVAGLREDIERARSRQQLQAASTMQEIIDYIETPTNVTIGVQLGQPTTIDQILMSKKITEIVKLFAITVDSTS